MQIKTGESVSFYKGGRSSKRKVELSGSSKQSAKGVTMDARSKMAHEMYKQVLNGGETVRLVNTRTASSKFQLMTIVCNKKSLSGYDDKRFARGNVYAENSS